MTTFLQPPFWAYDRGGARSWPARWSLSLVTPPVGEPLSIAEAKSQVRLGDTAGEPLPAAAPVLALAGLGAGLTLNGVRRIAVSFVTADGETPPGPMSAPVTITDLNTNGRLAVSSIPVGGPNVTTVKLWMPATNTLAPLFYVGSVANGVTTATINLADSSFGASAPTVNTTADPELAMWISAARFDVEQYTQRVMLLQSWKLTFDRFPLDRHELAIPIPPLHSVEGIDYVDASGVAQTLDPATYEVDIPVGPYASAGRVALKYGTYYWPFPPAMRVLNGVTVRFTAGYGTAADVPATLKAAMKLLIGNWWANREAGELIRGSADVLPFGVDRLLTPFVQETIA